MFWEPRENQAHYSKIKNMRQPDTLCFLETPLPQILNVVWFEHTVSRTDPHYSVGKFT